MKKDRIRLPNWINTILRRALVIAPMFVLGRFRICRVAYSHTQRFRQSVGPIYRRRIREKGKPLQPRRETIFPEIDVDRSVEELRDVGVSLGLSLPANLVDQLRDLASTLPLQNGVRSEPFMKSDVAEGGRLKDGEMVSLGMAYRQRKSKLLDHDCVSQIVHDPLVLEIVSRYLGYWPNRLSDLELYWSFVTTLSPDEQISQGNAIDCHFDLHGFNFVMVAFYLTNTDRNSGAHVMFEKSHVKKTLPMLFSWSQPAELLRRHYGYESEKIIEGQAGSGFVIDNSCYHSALTPEASDRLLLRFVYT